jgi:hypothetical protein
MPDVHVFSLKTDMDAALIKKKIKFSSYIRKFRVEHAVAKSYIYEEGLPNI